VPDEPAASEKELATPASNLVYNSASRHPRQPSAAPKARGIVTTAITARTTSPAGYSVIASVGAG
jgi:hypothetical protein